MLIPYAGKPRNQKTADFKIGNTSSRRFARAELKVSAEVYELRQARISAGLSQTIVAKTVGVSSKSISEWETGNARPTQANLKSWKAAMHVLVKGQPPFEVQCCICEQPHDRPYWNCPKCGYVTVDP